MQSDRGPLTQITFTQVCLRCPESRASRIELIVLVVDIVVGFLIHFDLHCIDMRLQHRFLRESTTLDWKYHRALATSTCRKMTQTGSYAVPRFSRVKLPAVKSLPAGTCSSSPGVAVSTGSTLRCWYTSFCISERP
jgi:hypothetical protein